MKKRESEKQRMKREREIEREKKNAHIFTVFLHKMNYIGK
jgi:hypothetical protein